MWLFENKKRGCSRIVKIFGNVVYIVTNGYKKRTQRFLGNLILTLKVKLEDDTEIKSTKVFGKEITKRIEDENYRKVYFLEKLVCSKNLKQIFQEKNRKYFNGYDDVLILNANSGEIYLFLTYLLVPFLKKINSTNFILVATKKYHVDLIKLLWADVPYIYIPKLEKNFKNLCTTINRQRFFTLFRGEHFIKVEQDIKNNPIDTSHYFYSIIDELKIDEKDLDFREAKVPAGIHHSLLKKIKKTKLNLNNFVFIAPEAVSCEEYDNDFWVDLCEEFNNAGIDVFMNIVDKDTDIIGCDYKTCKLTFSEAFALAKLSKGVVSLRSGLTESLLQTNVPLFSLYTKFRNRYVFNDMAVEFVLSGFGLNKLPNINPDNLYEFNMSELSNKNVLMQIVNSFTVKKQQEKDLCK